MAWITRKYKTEKRVIKKKEGLHGYSLDDTKDVTTLQLSPKMAGSRWPEQMF